MKHGKSPGTDGFVAEFFKFFWKELGPLIVRSLNEAFRDGELSSTQKEGLITCVPKEDKPKEYLKNWRPISLLNVIYKIGSSCIANRLKNVLPQLINEDQTGFMTNRYIGDNIRLIYDLMNYLNSKNMPGLLLSLDFEKAFDSLDWDFMFKVLQAFNFGQDLCKWVRTFYTDIKSSIIVNGQCTKWFSVKRGCRQGDPISPYLFLLSVEILATMIRENENIVGISMNNTDLKISQFADDAQMFTNGDKKSFEVTIETINKFSTVSGLYLNNQKTKAIWLGSKKHCNTQYMSHLEFEWNPQKFKILGIWFTQNIKDCIKLNYSEKLYEIKVLIKIWLRRIITPLGRVAVLKSLILSKLTHLWILLPNPPQEYMEELQKMCFQFVWNKKQDRISRKTVVKQVKKGGLGIPELKSFASALKLMWIRKLKNSEHKWKNICLTMFPCLKYFEYYDSEIVAHKDLKENSFWQQVMTAYGQLVMLKNRP